VRTQFDWAGVILYVCIAAIGFGAAYLVWPAAGMDKPLSALTVSEALRIIGSLLLGLILGVGGLVGAIKDANEPLRFKD
jgi:hypothetical protein